MTTLSRPSRFSRATKAQSRLRLALAGPAGAGKTYTGLTIAAHLARGGPIALIDTEHGSASKYADEFAFDALTLTDFHPDRYIEAIQDAASAGYTVLVIDSLSHAWAGPGGVLEVVDNIAARNRGGSKFDAWRQGTPLQNRLVETILAAPLHVIATMRSKTEYIVEQAGGKTTIRKVGLAPVQRDQIDFEFDIFGDLDAEHTLVVTKSRCRALADTVIRKPGAELAATLLAWLTDGIPAAVTAPPPPTAARPAARPAGAGLGAAPAGPAPPPISGLAPLDDALAGVPDGDDIGASDSYVDSLGYPHQSAAPAVPDLPDHPDLLDRPAPSDPPTLAQLRELKALAAALGHLFVQPRTASAAVDLLKMWHEEQAQRAARAPAPTARAAHAATAARPESAPRSKSAREHYDELAALAKDHGHADAVISIAIDAPDNFIREAYRALRRELVKAGVLRAPGPAGAALDGAAAAPATAQANVSSPATPAQVETMGKLATALGKVVATDGLTRAQASELITRLSEARYGQNRREASR